MVFFCTNELRKTPNYTKNHQKSTKSMLVFVKLHRHIFSFDPKVYSKFPPPPRIDTFKLLKGCHLGFGNLKTFLKKKHFPKKKIFFQKQKQKNLYFPHPRSKDATWGFRSKKSGNPWGGGSLLYTSFLSGVVWTFAFF